MHRQLIKPFIAAMMLVSTSVFALPSDKEQPIEIEADHAQMDDVRGVTIYSGNAILTQGTLKIEGNTITFYYDEQKQLKKVIAVGNLAKYKQVQNPGEEPVRARALQMEYHAANQKVFLLGKGHMWQNGDEFTGNRIEYDINRDLVIAKSTTVNVGDKKVTPTERVHVVIQPQQNRNKPAKSPAEKTTKPAEKPQAVTEQPSTNKAQQKPAEKETPVESKPAPAKEETPAEPDDSAPSTKSDVNENSANTIGITLSNINVRSGPGTNFDKVAQFNINTAVTILDTQQGWHQVTGLANGKKVTGWLSARYVNDVTQTTAARTLDNINVRSGPSTKFDKIAQFKENTRIAILASKDGWHQVVGNVAGKRVIGWLSARYVALSKAQ